MKTQVLLITLLVSLAPVHAQTTTAPRSTVVPIQPSALGAGGGASRVSSSSSSPQVQRAIRFDSQGRAARPVIVSSKPFDAKEHAAAEEDLGIMARLLEKEIQREAGGSGMPNAMGIAIVSLEGRAPSVMLLEDYGAVFAFNVNMSLTPSPARATEKKADQPTDSPWERTRRELFGPGGGGGQPGGTGGAGSSGARVSYGGGAGGMGGGPGFVGGMGGDPYHGWSERLPYDAKKVETLKKSLLEATKHAANIRALKPGDYLTVVVNGSGSGGAGMSEFTIETRSMSTTSGGGQPRVETMVNRGGDSARSGTLTLRVKKSDAEDFAKGKLTAEQFEQKALVMLR